eukprot:8191271-Pyramimonas_sp.AAC.1
MTHYVLARISRTHPALGHRVWIDDLSQWMSGSRQSLAKGVTACLGATFNELAKWHLDVSPNSLAICSFHGGAADIAK